MKGKVKFFNDMKGFGFIIAEDGKEYFVHQTGLKEGVSIRENDSVTFDVEEGDKGPKAVNVELSTEEAGEASAEETNEVEEAAEVEEASVEETAEEESSEEAGEEAPAEEATEEESKEE